LQKSGFAKVNVGNRSYETVYIIDSLETVKGYILSKNFFTKINVGISKKQ
jgi:hypothetical protein